MLKNWPSSEPKTKTGLFGTGSISTSLAGWGLATTALLTGERHYLEQAQQQMSWILGCNPTTLSMMRQQPKMFPSSLCRHPTWRQGTFAWRYLEWHSVCQKGEAFPNR